jgi:hypothetical protein
MEIARKKNSAPVFVVSANGVIPARAYFPDSQHECGKMQNRSDHE